MITLATPMLNVLYPLLLSQIILSFFSGKIRKDSVFQGAALATLIVCILGVAADFGASTDFVHHLPLSSLGLYWILPAGIGAALGALVPTKK
jgi:LIVCS family branched-chain amino acid:cation transporter